ncbi:unnamed protein product [Symbiodinium natans]|uniref:Uncharacterized protein n=1 Tax=Symbiodinium natans TaxID=878477 RepID=A0A812H2K6_9DINO|nr:unnamed protein product [Symbiodinium natans]
MGRTSQKGVLEYTKDGFDAIFALDNSNVYAAVLSEMMSNTFKEGMWFKALTPYMLLITNNDPIAVGNMITLNGLTRALVGVSSGRLLINNFGIDAVWILSGVTGVVGLLVNVICLCQGSVAAAYFLNFVWAVYNGLWNSCLETSWARSIIKSKREDANGARQITNKVTTSLGPLISAAIFLYCGNQWDMGLVQNVMLLGTGMTSVVVALCFCFRSSLETEQDLPLREIESIQFPALPDSAQGPATLRPEDMSQKDFVPDDDGYVMLTSPLGGNSDAWASRIRIVTTNYRETPLILVKQFRAALKAVHPANPTTSVLCFRDASRAPVAVEIESLEVYLSQVQASNESPAVDLQRSSIRFSVDYKLVKPKAEPSFGHIAWGLILGSNARALRHEPGLEESLLAGLDSEGSRRIVSARGKTARDMLEPKRGDASKTDRTNILGANVIVTCDVLNALASGFSLKFVDLFLKVDYGVSPAGVFLVAFLQNILGAWLTPVSKKLLVQLRAEGYRAKLGVVFLWSLALFFLALLCIPGMPLWVVIPSIILMRSLNSCTRAFNRAQLIDFLPREKIATYMTWDALNKANQGGIAIFGGQVVAFAGYRGCFVGTLILLLLRTIIYLVFALRKGTVYRGGYLRELESRLTSVNSEQSLLVEDLNSVENLRAVFDGDQESQMFQPAEALALASENPAKLRGGQDDLLEVPVVEELLFDEHAEQRPPSRRATKEGPWKA